MKQTIRKILSVVLALTIVLSVGIISMSTGAAGSILFSDDFSASTSLTERGWHSNNLTVVDGAVRIDNGRLTLSAFAGATAWTDYSVEADVRIDGIHSGTTANDIVAAVGVRSNAGGSTAYEFGIVYKRNDTSNTYVRLHQRGGTSFTSNPTTNNKNPYSNTAVDFTYNQTQHLRIDVLGDVITCYLNNKPTPVFTVSDSAFAAGTISLRAVNSIAFFDNIVVKTLSSTAESSSEVSSDAVTSTPESSSSETSSDNSNIYFTEDFSAANTSGRGWNKNWDTPNGYATVTNTNNYLIANAAYKAWTDYAVEADVSIDLTNAATASMNHATLVGRAINGNTGYEFRLITSNDGATTKAQLYEQGTGNIASADEISWDYSKTHKMKMVFDGNNILCFVDGILVMKTTSTAYSAGSIAIKGAGYVSAFDNIVVRAATAAEKNAQFPQDTSSSQTSSVVSSETSSTVTSSAPTSSATSSGSGNVYFSDDFSAANTSGRGWNKNWETPNGNVTVANTNNYLVGRAEYKAWTDYAVEADAFIDLNTPNDVSLNHATLVGHTTGGTNGYEFRIITQNNGTKTNAKLYDMTNRVNIAGADNIEWDYSRTYRLKMVFDGLNILCFIDDELVMKATTAQATAGSIALKSAGYATTFDNVVVRAATTEEKNADFLQDSSSQPSSGQDGDVYFTEDFSSAKTATANGWNKALTTTDGYLAMENTGANNIYLTAKSAYKAWTNYAAEVDLKIDPKAVVPDSGTRNYANLVFRSVSGTTGYYFRFMTASDGSKYVDLYDVSAKKTIAANKNVRLYHGIKYRFKVVVQDDLILCFINDELVLKTNSTTALAGSIALRNEGNAARFDNVIVRKATQAEINAEFKQIVAPSADNKGVYFADEFNTRKQSLSTVGLWNQSFKNVVSGQAVLSEEYQAGNYVVGDGGFFLLSDYTVESQVILPNDVNYDGGTVTAGIAGRITGSKTGYEFYISLSDDGSLSSAVLYNRTNNKKLASNDQIKLEKGAEYTLAMAMIGSSIRCYIDGALVLEVTDNSINAGTAGIATTGIAGYYNNFVVRKVNTAELKGISASDSTTPGTGDRTIWFTVALIAVAMLCIAYMMYHLRRKRHKQ